MPEFAKVPLVFIGDVRAHPNADTLSITEVDGAPVIFRTGDLKPGSMALYIPIDAVVKEGTKGLEFLKFKDGKSRVKAVRLRGIFSMGLLIPAPTWSSMSEAANGFGETLDIEKYEEPAELLLQTESIVDPGLAPVYGVESYRKYKNLLALDEVVVVTEKIHGCNARFCYYEGQMYAGSHRLWKAFNEDSVWWRVVKQYDLEEKLKKMPGLCLFGEIYGWVQDLRYGAKPGEVKFAAFDVLDVHKRAFLGTSEFKTITDTLEIPTTPLLYTGPYQGEEQMQALTLGESLFGPNMREGIVIKTLEERYTPEVGRIVLKLHSEEYLLRRDGTEAH